MPMTHKHTKKKFSGNLHTKEQRKITYKKMHLKKRMYKKDSKYLSGNAYKNKNYP